MRLEQVVAQLAAHADVDGIVVMGSAATGALSPASDYDLLVVLSTFREPLFQTVTEVDGRFAEFYFVSTTSIDAIVMTDDLPRLAREERGLFGGTLLGWIKTGTIAFDRHGALDRARQRVRSSWYSPVGAEERYLAWFRVNYDLAQTTRMAASDDPTYATAVDLRLLYTISDLWRFYFRLRDIPSGGEKADIRYLREHDPDVLERFQGLLAEPARQRKLMLYRELAAVVLAPVGGLWPQGATAVQLQPGADTGPEAVARALAVWRSLVGDRS